MRHIILIRPEAEEDLTKACDWYKAITPVLRNRFLDEVAGTILELERDPLSKPLYYHNFRRILLRRFPYKLFYQVIEQRVIVFRLLHAKQCHEHVLPSKHQ